MEPDGLGIREDEIYRVYSEERRNNFLDPNSTIATRVAKRLDIPRSRVLDLIRDHSWDIRFVEEHTQRSQAIADAADATSMFRLMGLAQEMQRVARKAILSVGTPGGLEVRTLEEARRLAQTGFEIEQSLLGKTTHHVQVDVHQVDERISYLSGLLKEEGYGEIIEGEAKTLDKEE